MPGLARRIEATRDRIVDALGDGRLLLRAGVVVFVVGCLLPQRERWGLPWSLAAGPTLLLHGDGRALGDFAAEIVGFRRLVEGRDPYPVLGEGFREIGIDWNVEHTHTHPPTSFLLAAPVGFLSVPAAARWWAATGYALVFAAALLYGLRPRAALGIALAATAWKPFAASFQQVTFVWLACVAVAWRLRERSAFWSGAALGFAALTKILPLGILGWFVFQRRWRAVAGAVAVVAAAVAVVWLVHPGAFARWLEVRGTLWDIILRRDNAAPLRPALAAGPIGLLALGAFVVGLLARNARALFAPASHPEYAFFLYSYLAVLLLPIAWGYSMASLLPVLGWFALRGRAEHAVLAAGIFVGLAIHRVFGSPWTWLFQIATAGLFLLAPPSAGALERDRATPAPAAPTVAAA